MKRGALLTIIAVPTLESGTRFGRDLLHAIRDKAGVKRFGFHALRRFVAWILSGQYECSIPPSSAHDKPTATNDYVQNIGNDVQQAIDMPTEGDVWILPPEVKKRSGVPQKYPASFEAASPAGFEPASPA